MLAAFEKKNKSIYEEHHKSSYPIHLIASYSKLISMINLRDR